MLKVLIEAKIEKNKCPRSPTFWPLQLSIFDLIFEICSMNSFLVFKEKKINLHKLIKCQKMCKLCAIRFEANFYRFSA